MSRKDRAPEHLAKELVEAPMAPSTGAGGSDMSNRSELPMAGADASKTVRRVRAGDVLGPRGILQIEHEGEIYTLRLTRNNRLILTK